MPTKHARASGNWSGVVANWSGLGGMEMDAKEMEWENAGKSERSIRHGDR